ncbi:hypothetical protein SHKM778_56780 [Streptomyces sp. KM77-8]|uniref:Uncharacterized protein n=1 Tax=Streptomyces haneummycinicus TaxID=3074435 RepID=A0AAT9HPE5_9ACTN
MRVGDMPGEGLEAGEIRHVGESEVTAGDDHVVEFLGRRFSGGEIFDRERECLTLGVVFRPAYDRLESDEIAYVRLLQPGGYVVPQHRARRV